MDTKYTSLNLVELKDVYWVFNRGGHSAIRSSELTSSSCSIFLIFYLYVIMFRVNWSAVIESPEHKKWFTDQSENPCQDVAWCSIALYSNLSVTFVIMTWSVLASILRCIKSRAIQKRVSARIGNCNLDGSTRWDVIAENMSMNAVSAFGRPDIAFGRPVSDTQNISFFLCAETRQTALVLKLLRVDPSSIWVSRYLVWAIQSTLSISRRGVIIDASALNLEIDGGDTLDFDASVSRIHRVAAFLVLTSPFFILYYFTRILIQEFHHHKARNGADKYTWSVGAQYALRKKNELPHRFNRRLRNIQEHVEAVKKSRKYSSYATCALNICQFILTCGLITCAIASCISIEEGVWNEPMGVMTGGLSACLMIGMGDRSKILACDVKKLEKKIKLKMGKSCTDVECFLKPRAVHVMMELLGVIVSPFFLIMRLLPKLDEISIAIEMDSPVSTDHPNLYFEEPLARRTNRNGYYDSVRETPLDAPAFGPQNGAFGPQNGAFGPQNGALEWRPHIWPLPDGARHLSSESTIVSDGRLDWEYSDDGLPLCYSEDDDDAGGKGAVLRAEGTVLRAEGKSECKMKATL